MPRARWGRAVRDAFTERLGYKAAALFFSVALWVAASGEETADHYVTVRFVPNVDSSLRLVGAPPTVRVLVAGPTRELLKLYAAPPALRHTFGPATPESMRLELRPNDVDLPAGVSRVVVRDIEPHVVALRFRRARPAAAPGVSLTPAAADARPLDSVRLANP